ncbi:nucleoside deaminase [Desulfurivibrio sp. D14AmB]|uniref:nucleoside deaminase n=1 Tax=Desulfurivibrio sp. D14AmB TaxID=3374370 RepID=UPI00376EC29E
MSSTDEHFMDLALEQARTALLAGEFPVGAVLVAGGRVVADGGRRNSRSGGPEIPANELDHAEIVALRELLGRQPAIERRSLTLYSTMEPCLMCYATLLLNGVRRIVYAYEDAMGGGTNLPLPQLAPLYREMAAEVEIVPHVRRQQSLELFKQFFRDPANNYWRGSLLEKYTLAGK